MMWALSVHVAWHSFPLALLPTDNALGHPRDSAGQTKKALLQCLCSIKVKAAGRAQGIPGAVFQRHGGHLQKVVRCLLLLNPGFAATWFGKRVRSPLAQVFGSNPSNRWAGGSRFFVS